jgi:hypothetical protein
LSPSRLLYPVAEKGYANDPAIRAAWDEVQSHLRETLFVTIFGYGAPASDAEAVRLMSDAWGDWRSRQFEQIEFIDKKSEQVLLAAWEAFVHSHHYDVFASFRESWVARHPRRSIEAFRRQYLDADVVEDNVIPDTTVLQELQDWFARLVDAESA